MFLKCTLEKGLGGLADESARSLSIHKNSKDMDEKSMRDPEKVKDVEDVTIERSIRMKEGAKTKIQDKLIV